MSTLSAASAFWVGAAFILFASLSLAQAPVSSREAVPPQGTNSAAQMLVEMQALRDEVSLLRGNIEELEYQVQRLSKKQQENYTDLDGRVADLYSGVISRGAPVASPSSSQTQRPIHRSETEPSSVPHSESSSSGPDVELESRRLYDEGFAALRQGEREQAIQVFSTLVETYPEAREAADARYWLGETYWLANKKEQSRQAFVQLLELTPDYRKAGDAMYRLGVIYDQLGDSDTAFDYMSQVLLNASSQSAAAQAWINEHTKKNQADSPEVDSTANE